MRIANTVTFLALLPLVSACSSSTRPVPPPVESPPCDAGVLGVAACSQIDWTVDGNSFSTDFLNTQQDLDFAAGALVAGQLSVGGLQLSQTSSDRISISVAVPSEGTFIAEAGDVTYRREVGDVEEVFSNVDGTFSVVVANVRDDRVDGSFAGPLVSETDGREVQTVGTFALVCCDTQ